VARASEYQIHLPLIPASVLRKHRVLEPSDHRFRACARLLQALWRERQELPIGTFESPNQHSRRRRIGSLIAASAADAGRNFLSPDIADVVRREMVYRELGAFIDQNRLYGNLLSSMPLCFNLFAPLRLNPELAAKVIRNLLPGIDLSKVLRVGFEHSPGRNNPALTGDASAFDVAILYELQNGERGFIGIEMKYSESLTEPVPPALPDRYQGLAADCGLFNNPGSALLRVNPLQQLFREHLLAQAALIRGDWSEAWFVLVSPVSNHLVQNGAALYASHLAEPGPGQVPFINLQLEQVIEAIGWAGELDLALALHDRYTDWTKLDHLIDEALEAKPRDWSIAPPRVATRLTLIGSAA
jgi:hypothetical protein